MSARFTYVTEWRLDAPIGQVWDALADVEHWPAWWPHVRSVRTLHPGGPGGLGSVRRLRWSSRLPYGFTLDVETTALQAPARLVGRATGDMAGTGTWELACAGAGTRVRYTWALALNTRWMRLVAPFMAPVFRWNHEGVMRSGGQGLARWLRERGGLQGSRTDAPQSAGAAARTLRLKLEGAVDPALPGDSRPAPSGGRER